MTTPDNEAVVRGFFNSVSGGNSKGFREFCTPDYARHDPQLPVQDIIGIDNYEEVMAGFFTGFPDIQVTVDDAISQGDKVACRWTITGTHSGNLGDIPPTGKQVEVSASSMHRIEGGKMADS